MARLGIHKRGHGLEKMLGQSVAHKKPRDLHTSDQMEPHPMTSEVHPDISSLAGPDMSGQASTKGSPYMGGMSVDSSGTTASAGFKKGGMALKKIDKEKNPGLSKLPTEVRNKMGYMKKGGSTNWIQSAIKHPGSLKKSLHVKAGQKIPAKKLAAAAKKPGVMGRRARLAETLRSLKK
jgi:hypothetical protein